MIAETAPSGGTKINKCYVGSISLGFNSDGSRKRRSVRSATKSEVKDKLDELHQEIHAGVRTPATYTVELSTQVTETVYRHVIVPEIRGGAAVMDDVLNANEDDTDEGNQEG